MKLRLFVFFANMVAVPIGSSVDYFADHPSNGNLAGYLSWWQHQWPFALTAGALVGGIQFLAWPWVMRFAQKVPNQN